MEFASCSPEAAEEPQRVGVRERPPFANLIPKAGVLLRQSARIVVDAADHRAKPGNVEFGPDDAPYLHPEAIAGPIRLLGAKILCELRAMADDQGQAECRYRSAPIPAVGGRTAQQLAESGDGEAVVAYFRHLSPGGLA